ncbi:DUF1302 domain-containing protein [Permianibacter sp. IMCC34836]|uniref:DUF1302 domain-containing protein n=1 Tax=Permianibacter fluminis TaxID=2738515 RepID=UPI0015535C70|nr:DUF1302 domain-containing protein [Permianibacter fluminis]NQD37254.1 DUF1302 domain-containing protein [Permianibacter fluminis]
MSARLHKLTAVASGVLLSMAAAQPAKAVDISAGNWEGSFDSTFTVGAGWRMEDRDEAKIGKANGGTAWSNNNDDGNLNFDKGETFSKAIKGLHELDLHHADGYGIFVRGTWLYDYELMRDDREFKELSDAALDRQGEDARLLDTYLYLGGNLFERPFQVRIGEQVFNWGESTLIQHSISEANALDLAKLRVPGAELKEAFIPAKAIWASYQIAENVGVEAYAQFEWEPVVFDSPGTFLSTQDFVGDTEINEDAQLLTPGGLVTVPSACNGSLGMVHLLFGQVPESNATTQACRTADRDASDHGQFGVKLSWLSEMLGDTEFGFYYINYHNKRPVISANAHNGTLVEGFFEYPEDIKLLGISFNTSTDSGWSIAGEVSQRQDEPLQIDDVELLFKTLEPVGLIAAGTSQITPERAALPGQEISGYRLFDTYQAQITLTKLFGSLIGADQFTFLTEIGGNWIPDLPSQDELRFEVAGTSRSGNPDRAGFGLGYAAGTHGFTCVQRNVRPDLYPTTGAFGECEGTETNEFATANSWGYRMIVRAEYNDAFWGVNVTPRLVFQHDVKGYTPAPISNFMEDRKAATFGVTFDYLQKWRWDISYSAFFGNDDQDPLSDRDFISAYLSYSI